MSEKTLAENLIQIWCKKRCAHDHQDGDVYELSVEIEDYGSCPTCSSPYIATNIYRTRTKSYNGPNGKLKTKRERKVAWSGSDINFTETLNEMLFALKPIEE